MKPFFATIALLLICLNAQAGLNKWVDSEGKVHYSDSAPPEVTPQTVRNISGKGQAEAPASYSPKSYAEREAEMRKSKQEKQENSAKQTQESEQAEAKQHNCIAAKENLRTLEESSRIVTYDANGERTYLDDAAREQRIADARKSISSNCN